MSGEYRSVTHWQVGNFFANPDGIDAGGPMLETLALLGIFTQEAAEDLNNPRSCDAIESTANAILSALAFTLKYPKGSIGGSS